MPTLFLISICVCVCILQGFPGGSDGKESTCNGGDTGWEYPLEKGMATHCSILAWRTPRTEEPDGLQSMGSQESDTTEATNTTHSYVQGFMLIPTSAENSKN